MSTSALHTAGLLLVEPTRRPRSRASARRWRVAAALGVAVVLLLTAMAGSAWATTPRPAPGDRPGVSTTYAGGISVFYRTATTNTLTHRSGTSAQWNAPEDLGGRLISGPPAITIGSEFATTWAFAVGTDNGVWYRGFSDGLGEWSRWLTLGGFAAGPTTTCVGDVTAQPIVYVMGRDFALWRRALAGGSWQRLGGQLVAGPGALPAVGGGCPSREDVFVVGTDRRVWEWRAGGFRRVPGGWTEYAPAAAEHPDGRTDLFVRGSDDALWMNTRPSVTGAWSGWRRVGGILSSAPVANLFPDSPLTRVVFALGADGDVWQGRNVVGTSTWRWSEVP
jgi:hypothetical protein